MTFYSNYILNGFMLTLMFLLSIQNEPCYKFDANMRLSVYDIAALKRMHPFQCGFSMYMKASLYAAVCAISEMNMYFPTFLS